MIESGMRSCKSRFCHDLHVCELAKGCVCTNGPLSWIWIWIWIWILSRRAFCELGCEIASSCLKCSLILMRHCDRLSRFLAREVA